MKDFKLDDHLRLLAASVIQARSNHQMTQEDLAEKTSVSHRTIQNIESANSEPRMGTLIPLCRALNLDPRIFICPDTLKSDPHIAQLNQLVADCSEDEAKILIPVITSLKNVLRHQPDSSE